MTLGFAPLSTLPISGLPSAAASTPVVAAGTSFPAYRVLLKRKYLYPDDAPVLEALEVKPSITAGQLEELVKAILGIASPVKVKRPYVVLQAKPAPRVDLSALSAMELSHEASLSLKTEPLVFLSQDEWIYLTQQEAVVLSYEN